MDGIAEKVLSFGFPKSVADGISRILTEMDLTEHEVSVVASERPTVRSYSCTEVLDGEYVKSVTYRWIPYAGWFKVIRKEIVFLGRDCIPRLGYRVGLELGRGAVVIEESLEISRDGTSVRGATVYLNPPRRRQQ